MAKMKMDAQAERAFAQTLAKFGDDPAAVSELLTQFEAMLEYCGYQMSAWLEGIVAEARYVVLGDQESAESARRSEQRRNHAVERKFSAHAEIRRTDAVRQYGTEWALLPHGERGLWLLRNEGKFAAHGCTTEQVRTFGREWLMRNQRVIAEKSWHSIQRKAA